MKKRTKLVLAFSLAAISVAFPQQNAYTDIQDPNFQKLESKLSNFMERVAPEKIYLQTDKDFYTNGETIWFNTYLLDAATHLPSKKSQVVYVELLDTRDSLVAQRTLFVNLFAAAGDIQITEELPEGTYRLRAYTKYMLNDKSPTYFQKTVPIWVQKLNPSMSPEVYSARLKSGRAAITQNEGDLPKSERNVPKNAGDIQENAIKRSTSETVPKEIKVRLFPEGGDLVAGLESAIGLKVTDESGNGIALEGKIKDRDGNLIAPFRTHKFGLGVAQLTPLPGMDYRATIVHQGKEWAYPLPKALASGYGLQIRNQDDHILLKITTNKEQGLEGSLLLGHLRGKTIFKEIVKENGKNTVTYKLLTDSLDNGVAHFTLFTSNGEPVCERLVFVDNPKNDLQLSISKNNNSFGFREQAAIDLALDDDQGNPLGGSFSLSVAAENAFDSLAPDIESWLLLNSDLEGTLENAGYFFEEDSYARKYLLDILMLTHGWRRFVWKDLLEQKVSPHVRFPPEQGLMVTGKTTSFNNQYQPKKTMTTLSIFDSELYQERKATNAQGRFSYGPFYFRDSVEAIINAVDIDVSQVKNSEFSIYVDPSVPKVHLSDSTRQKHAAKTITIAREYLETAFQKKVADFKYDPRVTKLNEVTVAARKKTRQELIDEELNAMTLYGEPSNRLLMDSIPASASLGLIDLLRLVPGVQVFGTYPNQSVLIRGLSSLLGSSEPLFLLDGVPVDAGVVQQMRANESFFIDVLKGPEAALYGVRAGNGVVAVYTNKGHDFSFEEERYPNVANFKIPGFYKAREFYSPDYDRPIVTQKPDYRTTLYWKPDISINERGKSSVEFFTGDSPGTYQVIVEGISNDGRPVRGVHSFQIAEDY